MIVKILLILACSLSGYSIAYHSYNQWWQWATGWFWVLSHGHLCHPGRAGHTEGLLPGDPGRGGGDDHWSPDCVPCLPMVLSFVSNIMEKTPGCALDLHLAYGYHGLSGSCSRLEEGGGGQPVRLGARPRKISDYRILDTRCRIDGRIADICDFTGFMEGNLIVPRFCP